jgi:hypothetical protein
MKQVRVVMLSALMVLLCNWLGQAQQSVATDGNRMVPPLLQFSNIATDAGGSTLSGAVSITFSLYNNQQGGEPLWLETQNNVQLDSTGHYSVQLGITKPSGVPTTLFTTGQARWLGVRINEQAEQPRALLLSVPYALKAGDAATIGGLPPSAFVLATPLLGSNESAPVIVTDVVNSSLDAPPAGSVTGSGTTDFIPLWSSASNLGNSVLFQSGTGSTAKVGINTTTPASTLDVKGTGIIRGALSLPATGTATSSNGDNSQPLNMVASAFNSSSSAAANQVFRWQAEPAGNDTASPSGTLNLLFGEGSSAPSETGLKIANNGLITFATAQTLPGADVSGQLGATGNITGISTNGAIAGGSGIFASTLSAGGNITGDNITAEGTISAAAASIIGNILAGSIGTAGSASFGNISGFQTYLENSSTTQTLTLQNFDAPANNVFVEAQFNNAGKAIVWTDALGDFNALGTKSAVVPAKDGSMEKLFAVESPQVWFDDYGSGQLTAGAAGILLEAGFAQTVNSSVGYHVFLTPKGDCKGLFVTNETATGFEVKELGGGASSVAFDYRIVALRKGYENVRLPVTAVPKSAASSAAVQTR